MTFELTKKSEPERRTLSKLLPLWSGYANYFDCDSDETTSVVAAETWYKLNTDTELGFTRNGLSHSNNRITNTASKAVFRCLGIVSLVSTSAQEIHVAFFKNGELVPCTEQDMTTGAGTKVNNVTFGGYIELNQGDYVEVWVKNESSTADITLDNVNVMIEQL